MKIKKEVTFTSLQDFRNRIAALWQDQKEEEEYVFKFPYEEVEREFENMKEWFILKDGAVG